LKAERSRRRPGSHSRFGVSELGGSSSGSELQSVGALVDVAPLVASRVAEFVAVGGGEVVEDCGASGAWDGVLV